MPASHLLIPLEFVDKSGEKSENEAKKLADKTIEFNEVLILPINVVAAASA